RRKRQHPRHGTVADRADGRTTDGIAATVARSAARAGYRYAQRTHGFTLAPRTRQGSALRTGLARVRLRRPHTDLPRGCGAGLSRRDRFLPRIPRRHGVDVEL